MALNFDVALRLLDVIGEAAMVYCLWKIYCHLKEKG